MSNWMRRYAGAGETIIDDDTARCSCDYRISGNNIKDCMGNTVLKVDGNMLRDMSGNVLAQINGEYIEEGWSKKYSFDSSCDKMLMAKMYAIAENL